MARSADWHPKFPELELCHLWLRCIRYELSCYDSRISFRTQRKVHREASREGDEVLAAYIGKGPGRLELLGSIYCIHVIRSSLTDLTGRRLFPKM